MANPRFPSQNRSFIEKYSERMFAARLESALAFFTHIKKVQSCFMNKFFNNRILPFLAFVFIHILCSTCRVKTRGRDREKELEENGKPIIYVFWHGRMLYFPYWYRFLNKYTILVSPSKDGEIVSRISRLFGFFSVRGSGYKEGARALRQLIRILKTGGSIGIIGDGSRGPLFEAQKGIVRLASLSGAILLPMSYGAEKKIAFNSWDRFILPLPFSRVKVVYGSPIHVKKKINSTEEEVLRLELENSLKAITREADNED